MQLVTEFDRSGAHLEGLLSLWEASVRATHHFLSEEDILALRPLVYSALGEIPILVQAVDEAGKVHGFMGLEGDKIEMLFIHPQTRGNGLGRRFIEHAVTTLKARFVDVNEQNTQGTGFYLHLGFRVSSRSALDGQGKPFPILHLELGSGPPVPDGYVIRPAEQKHIQYLNDIELASAELFPPGSIPEHIRHDRVPEALLTEGMREGRLWVALEKARDTETAVGYGLLRVMDGFALLAQLDVHPAHGRKGLGTALVRQVIAKAGDMGFCDLYLTTFAHVPWNAPFYEKLGFEVLNEANTPAFLKEILCEERRLGLENRVGMCLALPVT